MKFAEGANVKLHCSIGGCWRRPVRAAAAATRPPGERVRRCDFVRVAACPMRAACPSAASEQSRKLRQATLAHGGSPSSRAASLSKILG